MPQQSVTPPPALLIRPTHGLAALNLRDLWVFRELVYFMTWRDLLVRYKQTALGVLWAVLQPVLQMLIFTLLFSKVAKLPSEGVPYPLYTLAALLPWTMFSKALTDAGRSLVYNRNMLTKIYFPRLIIPLASVLASVVDFLIAFGVLILMTAYYHLTGEYTFVPTAALWTLPLFLLLALVTALGVSLWLSALNVIYRDVGHVLPFLTQFWLFITPVGYSATVISPKWQVVYALNPMVGVVNGFRWALLGTQTAPDPALAVSAAVSLVVLVSGLFYFRSMERTFADEI
jgi:lipopolysaccharide transport system permease protein